MSDRITRSARPIARFGPALAAVAPFSTPGVTSAPPDDSGCGPCPGATLVLTPSGNWGRP